MVGCVAELVKLRGTLMIALGAMAMVIVCFGALVARQSEGTRILRGGFGRIAAVLFGIAAGTVFVIASIIFVIQDCLRVMTGGH